MKLSTFILASTLVITGSISAMEQQEKTNTEAEQIQEISMDSNTNGRLLQQERDLEKVFANDMDKVRKLMNEIKAQQQRKKRIACCCLPIAWLCCCPCMCYNCAINEAQ